MRFHFSWKSIWCSVSFFLVFTWFEAKWNSNRHGFQISRLDRIEISNRHEIFMWTKFTRSKMNKDSLAIVFNAYVRLKHITGCKFIAVILTEIISGDKICRHHSKWNAYAYSSKYRVVLKCSRNETSCEQNLL